MSSLRLFFLFDGVSSVDGSERQLPVIDAHYHQPILLSSSKKKNEEKTRQLQHNNTTRHQDNNKDSQDKEKNKKSIEKMRQSKLVRMETRRGVMQDDGSGKNVSGGRGIFRQWVDSYVYVKKKGKIRSGTVWER